MCFKDLKLTTAWKMSGTGQAEGTKDRANGTKDRADGIKDRANGRMNPPSTDQEWKSLKKNVNLSGLFFPTKHLFHCQDLN